MALDGSSSPHLPRQDSEAEAELKLALREASMEAGVTLAWLSPTDLFLQVLEDAIPVGKLANWLKAARRFRSHALNLSEAEQEKLSRDFSSLGFVGKLQKGDEKCALKGTSLVERTSNQGLTARERLEKASTIDISTKSLCWENLVSLQSIEHATESAHEENDASASLELTVNSGGLVFFALFHHGLDEKGQLKEAAACLKFTSSRLLTQAERLGYEIAKYLRVSTPQARVIHNGSPEWRRMKEAVQKIHTMAISSGLEVEEKTAIEMLEALNLSRCMLFMGYVHGQPLMESTLPFANQSAADSIAISLGRLLLLDLVLRNEDRLVCHELGWRGNPRNFLCTADKPSEPVLWKSLHASKLFSKTKHSNEDPRKNQINLSKRSQSAVNLSPLLDDINTKISGSDNEMHDTGMIRLSSSMAYFENDPQQIATKDSAFLVAIDSSVPRRPPSGKMTNDKLIYPKFVELLLNDSDKASKLLSEISGGKLGCMPQNSSPIAPPSGGIYLDQSRITCSFQMGFRSGLIDMQLLRLFLLRLYRELDHLLKHFIAKISQFVVDGKGSSPSKNRGFKQSPMSSPHGLVDQNSQIEAAGEQQEQPLKHPGKQPQRIILNEGSSHNPNIHSSEKQNSPSPNSIITRRLTLKLKEVNKTAKIDSHLRDRLKEWDALLRKECKEMCEAEGFVTGFLESEACHSLVDGYELKVRLEHLLERMNLISQGADTEKPSCVLEGLYIGGALAAKSINTLQHLAITHILCLCPMEFNLAEQYNNSFCYLQFKIKDTDDEIISAYFEDACVFIANATGIGGKVLVHCFEGKSRSATIILAYLMMHNRMKLAEAWNHLKARHRRSQPNHGFMKSLLELDRTLHGETSMDWQLKRPLMRTCTVCGKAVGFSRESLQHHMHKKHCATEALKG